MTPGGLWDSTQYEIKALIKYNGKIIKDINLAYNGSPSTFEGIAPVSQSGTYEVIVYAYDPLSGNTGVDKAVVTVN